MPKTKKTPENIEDKELVEVKTKLSRAITQANAIEIHTDEQAVKATEFMTNVKKLAAFIKQKKESVTKPLNEALKNARALFASMEDDCDAAERIIKAKIITYKQEVDAERAKQAAKIAQKVDDGKMSYKKAAAKMEQLPEAPPAFQSASGAAQFRKIKKVEIIDESKLPREYLIPNASRIRQDALAGVEALIASSAVRVYERRRR